MVVEPTIMDYRETAQAWYWHASSEHKAGDRASLPRDGVCNFQG